MNIVKTNLKFKSVPKKRKKTSLIVLHTTATPYDATPEQIHQFHIQRGWIGAGYNFLIRKDGTIYEMRPEECSGAHTEGKNSISIGIATSGGVDKNMKPIDDRTVEQKNSLYELVYYLMGKYTDVKSLEDIKCHRDFANKSCPNYSAAQFRNEYLKWIDEKQKKEKCNVKDWFK